MKGRKVLAKVLNGIGILLVLSAIVLLLPLSVPKLLGIQLYGIESGSMEPTYPVGGVVYVKPCDAEELQVGDVVTYTLGTGTAYVMTHRVVEIDLEAGTLITKGDANSTNDPEPVVFSRVVGKVVAGIPGLAEVAQDLEGVAGIARLVILFAIAAICWLVADILRKSAAFQSKENRETQAAQAQHPSKADPKPSKRSDHIRLVVRLAAVLMILGGGIYLALIFLEYHAGESEYAALSSQIVLPRMEGTSTSSQTDSPQGSDAAEAEDRVSDEEIYASVQALQEENPDMACWIAFEHLDISYPVMHYTDNDFYLRRTFSKEHNTMGSIFIDAINHPDLEDSHTIIYGHNMRNLTMFGKLRYYKEEDFYLDNQYFYLYTDSATYQYQIFAYYDVSEYSDIYTIWYTPDDNFAAFVEQMQTRSYYDTGIQVTAQDHIVTLSTCSTEGNRFVIHAKRVE